MRIFHQNRQKLNYTILPFEPFFKWPIFFSMIFLIYRINSTIFIGIYHLCKNIRRQQKILTFKNIWKIIAELTKTPKIIQILTYNGFVNENIAHKLENTVVQKKPLPE